MFWHTPDVRPSGGDAGADTSDGSAERYQHPKYEITPGSGATAHNPQKPCQKTPHPCCGVKMEATKKSQHGESSTLIKQAPRRNDQVLVIDFCVSVCIQTLSKTPQIKRLLTYVSPAGFDDDGAPAARLLLRLGHALLRLLVGIVSSTHGDFILYASKAIQMDIAIAARETQWEKRDTPGTADGRICHWRITEVALSK